MLAASFCCFSCRIFVVFISVLFSALASRLRCCILHGSGGIPPHGCIIPIRRLVVAIFVSVSSSLLVMCCSQRQRHPLSWLPFRHWRLVFEVVVVGVSSLSLFCRCRQRCPFLWLCPSAAAPSRRCNFCWVSYCRRRLVVVVVIRFSSLVSLSLDFLFSAASRCCCCCRLLIVVVVGGVLSLSAAAASRRSLKILVYIRLTIHATTMYPQHQAHNGTAAL